MRIPMTILCSILLAAGGPLRAERVALTAADLVPLRPQVWIAPELVLPPTDSAVPLLGAEAGRDGTRLLRHLGAAEDIAGFDGILYDNRDRGHSTLDPGIYPRLAFLDYDDSLVARGFDQGLAGRIILPHVVIGNASLAMTGALGRSLPRLAMTDAFWRDVTPLLYGANHLYVYPEHLDHDSADRFPLNWPYMVVSQGSSRSDRIFVEAFAMTLAAFPPETFAALREEGLVAPTLQMILRQNLAPVETRADYLSGVAHPPVFDGRQVRIGRMVAQASGMRPEDIPPLVVLRVIEEDFAAAAGLARLDERLLDSPAAIARLWRGPAWEREMTVTAEDTAARPGQTLSFEWRLLRGDPDRVRIEPLDREGRSARIHVTWHDPWTEPAPGQGGAISERRLSRVDIGVFAASGGGPDSAPALISIDFPAHQLRQYDRWADGSYRLMSIDHDARGREVYFDPLLYWSAPWTDRARYDAAGRLSGWERQDRAGETTIVPADAPPLSLAQPDIATDNPAASILRRPAD